MTENIAPEKWFPAVPHWSVTFVEYLCEFLSSTIAGFFFLWGMIDSWFDFRNFDTLKWRDATQSKRLLCRQVTNKNLIMPILRCC